MLRNYLKIAYRNLKRQKGYTLINVAGLAIGIACCVLIFLFVRSELAVNAVFEDAERIYRVDSDWQDEDAGLPFLTLAAASPTMERVYPEVLDQTRLYGIVLSVGVGNQWLRRDAYVADPSVLNVFDLPLLHGDPAAALREPRSVVLRADLARALFGTTDVVGRTVQLETFRHGHQPYTVTGVWEKLPENSFTQFGESQYQLLLPQAGEDFVQEPGWTSWQSQNILHFVKLAPGTDVEALRAKMDDFIEAYAPEEFHDKLSLELNPLSTLYLTDAGGRGRRVVELLSAIGVFLLLIAGINFTNLSAARSLTRAKEIGVRKTVGAQREQVMGQFLSESLLVSALATGLGALLAALCLEPFMRLMGKDLVLAHPWDGVTLLALAGITLVAGLGAGAYPAFVLSAFDPVRALKGKLTLSRSGGRIRHSLVVAQFAIAVVLLIGVFTVARQMAFMTGQDLGFQQENVLVIDTVPRDFSEAGLAKMETLKAALGRAPGVMDVSLSFYIPGGRGSVEGSGSGLGVHRPSWSAGRSISVQRSMVDDNFLETYDLALKHGRFFSDERPADSSRVVINEAAARALNLENPLGKTLVDEHDRQLTVVGVVGNFHSASLHAPIRPLAFVPVRLSKWYKYLSVRLAASGDLSEQVASVRQAWETVVPEAPFGYTFMDERVERAYRAEQRTRRIAGVAPGLAIVIACLGLFGLTAYAAERRAKEIGIRKVLGASVPSIVMLLSKDFLKLVLVAFVIAAPVAYFAMSRWLEDFAYRIDLGAGVFLLAGALALVIALATVSYQAIRAALANPVEALRSE